MNISSTILRRLAVVTAVAGLLAAGCGMIADKDRIKIAIMDGKPITRGDLAKVLREMDPDERPQIRTRGDVRKALENYIDSEIKTRLAEDLKQQQKIHVDRAGAEIVYRMKHPERYIKMSNPQDYNMTEADVKYLEQEREIGVDEELRRLEAEEAIKYRMEDALKSGLIQITDDEYKREFELRKSQLKHYETVSFRGIYIPSASADASKTAVEISKRLKGGEPADALVKAYADGHADLLEATLPNDPRAGKFASFWQQAAGAHPGDVLGPVVIQGWERSRVSPDGHQTMERIPPSFLVFQVVEEVPETPKTLEESKEDLTPIILFAKVMDQLRKEHGVQIYENNLPDPSMYETPQTSTVVLR